MVAGMVWLMIRAKSTAAMFENSLRQPLTCCMLWMALLLMAWLGALVGGPLHPAVPQLDKSSSAAQLYNRTQNYRAMLLKLSVNTHASKERTRLC